MAEIRPFSAIHYSLSQFGHDWSDLVAPPYDVLDAKDKEALLRRHDLNIASIDLPVAPAKQAGPASAYAAAAERLQRALSQGALVRDDRPALYVYHQVYHLDGHEHTRRMLFASVRLEPFGEGTIFAHELTHSGPKQDRLLLTRATGCQLSPVFALYSDPANAVAAALAESTGRPPDVTAKLDGVESRLWIDADPDTGMHVAMLLDGANLYIADGHHRYTTALNYRDERIAAGGLPDDHPARFVLMCLCAMEDPGCTILPTHRVLTPAGGVTPDALFKAWRAGCTFTPIDHGDGRQLIRKDAAHDIALYVGPQQRHYAGRFTDRSQLATLCPDRSDAWRRLDLAYLHGCLIDEWLTRRTLHGASPTIAYTPFVDEAERLARESAGVAVLVKPTSMDELRAVANARDLMPQKSTYFYPKLATGLVIHPVA